MGKLKKLFGTAVAAASVIGIYKYLKENHNLKLAEEEDITAVKNDAGALKDAAKRTYIALKNKSEITEPASDFGKAAGKVFCDAEKIAVSAGNGVSNVAAEIISSITSEEKEEPAVSEENNESDED